MSDPLAYFITWTTYGTWLTGDRRGWVSKIEPGVQPPSEFYAEINEGRMKEPPFVMSREDRRIVKETIQSHCEIRNWRLHAVNPRTNHAHVVLSAVEYKPETVLNQLKAWCTRRLKPAHPDRERFWTEGGSKRWINSESSLESAILYVRDHQ